MVVVDWEGGEPADQLLNLDPETLALKSGLGIPPYRIQSVTLRLVPNLELFREEFFQALSVSSWCQGGELFYAGPIEDEALADALRQLSNRFGIGITTFGLTAEMLDELPGPEHILTAQPRETEALMERFDVRRIASPRLKDHLDWASLDAIRSDNEEVRRLFNWLTECIETEQVRPFERER
jgi:hypothetical protein